MNNAHCKPACPVWQVFFRRLTFKKILRFIVPTICLTSALFLNGCGRGAPKLTSELSKAFDSASPEVKQIWEKALAADKANDYVAAAASLGSLSKMTLSEQQSQALNVEREAFGLRLMKAVEKNDPAAIKAAQSSQNSRNR